MADDNGSDELSDAEIAARMDLALPRMAITVPMSRNRVTPKEGAMKPREKPDHRIETSEN
jgi:hypothetical protein